MNIFIYGVFDFLNINELNLLKSIKLENPDTKLYVLTLDFNQCINLSLELPFFSVNHRLEMLKCNKLVDKVIVTTSKTNDELVSKFSPEKIINCPFKLSENSKNKLLTIPINKSIENVGITPKSYSLFLNGTYTVPPVPIKEIFPLKRYTFYNRRLWGPRTFKTMEKYYKSHMPVNKKDIMKYGYLKFTKKNIFRLKNKNPANVILDSNQDFADGCSKETKRCGRNLKKYNRNTICNAKTNVCCASHIVQILFYVIDVLEKHKITYFIYWGTLLGSLRHNGLIPWDTDADIYIIENDKDKVLDLKEEFNAKYYMANVNENFMRVCYSKNNVTHLDIYVANIIRNY